MHNPLSNSFRLRKIHHQSPFSMKWIFPLSVELSTGKSESSNRNGGTVRPARIPKLKFALIKYTAGMTPSVVVFGNESSRLWKALMRAEKLWYDFLKDLSVTLRGLVPKPGAFLSAKGWKWFYNFALSYSKFLNAWANNETCCPGGA